MYEYRRKILLNLSATLLGICGFLLFLLVLDRLLPSIVGSIAIDPAPIKNYSQQLKDSHYRIELFPSSSASKPQSKSLPNTENWSRTITPGPSTFRNLPFPIYTKTTNTQLFNANGEIVTSSTASIDPFARRATSSPAKKYSQYLIFIGCSYTFGFLVNDNETLPSRVAERAPNKHVYNYGVIGASAADSLLRLRSIDRSGSEIKEKTGTVVYVLMPDHYLRLMGSLQNLGSSSGQRMHYYLDKNGNIAWDGAFKDVWPIRNQVYHFLAKSNILHYFNIDYPWKLDDEQIRLWRRIIESMRDESKLLGAKNFVVMFWPDKHSFDLLIQAELEKAKVPYIVFPNTNLEQELGDYRFLDNHPNASAYSFLAEPLAEAISELK